MGGRGPALNSFSTQNRQNDRKLELRWVGVAGRWSSKAERQRPGETWRFQIMEWWETELPSTNGTAEWQRGEHPSAGAGGTGAPPSSTSTELGTWQTQNLSGRCLGSRVFS